MRETGIGTVGAVRWGSHFCQFYETQQELLEVLVPYFGGGLAANDCCLWIASPPLEVEGARAALREAVPDLDDRAARGQIEVLDSRDWCLRSGRFSVDAALQGWVGRLEAARAAGFAGFRLSADTSWLDEAGRREFARYEAAVNEVLGQNRVLALCTYSLAKCRAADVIEVLAHHDLAVARRAGQWGRIESATYRFAEERIRRQDAVQAGVGRIFREALTSETEEQLGRVCLAVAVDLTGSESGFVAEVDAEGRLRDLTDSDLGRRACRVEETPADGQALRGPSLSAIHARVLRDGLSFLANASFPERDGVGTSEGHPPVHSFLCAPLVRGGRVTGLVGLANRPGGFRPEDLEVVDALAPAIVQVHSRWRAERALRDSETRYRSIVETAQEGILIGSPEGRVLFANQKMADILGYSREEIVGRVGLELADQAEEDAVLRNRAALHAGGLVQGEMRFRRKDGAHVWTLWSASPLRDGTGRHIGNLAMHTDITERKRAEEALREARDHLEARVRERTADLDEVNRALAAEVAERRRAEEGARAERQRLYDVLETLPAYVILLAPDHHVVFANRFFRERFGESHGRRCFEYLFARSEPCENCESFRPLDTGAHHGWSWTGPDGRDYEIHDFPFRDADGSTLVLEMGIDVTERHRAEQKLHEHQEHLEALVAERTSALEQRNAQLVGEVAERQRTEVTLRRTQDELERSLAQLQAVLDHLTEGLIVSDLDGHLFHWNPAAVTMHGLGSAEEGQRAFAEFEKIFELSTAEEGVLPLDRWPLARILRGETLRCREVDVRRLDDARWRRVFNYGGTLARDRDGRAVLAVVSVTDITERKLAEAALRMAHDTLEERVQERTEELRQANHTLRMISDCNQVLVRATTEDELVGEICRVIHARGGYRVVWVGYAGPEPARAVRPVAVVGLPGDALDRAPITWADEPRGGGPTGSCIRRGQVCLGRDFLEDAELLPWRELAREAGYRSSIALPLVAEGRAFGALTICADAVGAFDGAPARLLGELADDLAFGILALRARAERDHARQVAEERARQLASLATELGRVEQRERLRLARLLHDHLQQLLVGAKYDLAALEGKLRRKAEQDDVRRLSSTLDDAMEAARTLTAELSPPVLHEKGLADALEWLARQARQKHGLSVEVRAERGAEPGDEQVRFFLFNAARELLLNVAKHAGVSRARVELERLTGEEIQVVVSDHGAGFDPARLDVEERGTGGFGLFSIRERLRCLGGRLTVESRPGQGSRFALVAPGAAPVAAGPAGAAVPAAPEAAVPVPRGAAVRGAAHRCRVLLADDHEVMRAGLARLLNEQTDMEVAGEACDGQEALELARRLLPDVVLMDVTMPRSNGLEATRQITRELPAVRVIGLSMHENVGMGEAMREAGAVDYLTKSDKPDRIVAAIRACRPRGESAAPLPPPPTRVRRAPARRKTGAPGGTATRRPVKTPARAARRGRGR